MVVEVPLCGGMSAGEGWRRCILVGSLHLLTATKCRAVSSKKGIC